MDPFSIFILIVAFIVGYLLGRGRRMPFNDPDLAHEAREMGQQAVQERIEKRKARILERARQYGEITNDGVEDLFCVSDSTARNYLNELEAEGKLQQHGEAGRGVFYTPR